MRFSLSTPGQLVFQTLPLQIATHIYTQVLPLKCRRKKALLPLYLVLGANCCARTWVVLSYCCNVFFQRRETSGRSWRLAVGLQAHHAVSKWLLPKLLSGLGQLFLLKMVKLSLLPLLSMGQTSRARIRGVN